MSTFWAKPLLARRIQAGTGRELEVILRRLERSCFPARLTMITKRKFERCEDPSSVSVKLYMVSGHQDLNRSTVYCHTRDISEEGICLIIGQDIPLDTSVKLRVAVADPPSSFVHDAEVRWTKPTENKGETLTGLEFVGGSDTHMEEWRGILRCIRSGEEGSLRRN